MELDKLKEWLAETEEALSDSLGYRYNKLKEGECTAFNDKMILHWRHRIKFIEELLESNKWKEQMAKKTLVHRGYHGSIEVNTDNFTLSGSILFIESDFKYEGETFEKLENNFIIHVEKHIANCDEKGVPVPFKEK